MRLSLMHRRRASSPALIVAFALLPFAVGHAQVPPVRDPVAAVVRPPNRILGTFDEASGEPVIGVEVMDANSGTSSLTTATGTVNLAFLIPDGGEIRLRKVGYAVQTMTVSMSPSDTLPITVIMKRVAELPAVVTRDSAPRYFSPTLKAFEERRKNATAGYFIDEKTLRKEDGRPLGNVLIAHAPGASVQQRNSANFLVKSPRCSAGGQPDVYIDGVPLAHLEDPRWQQPTQTRNRNTLADTRNIPIDIGQFQISDLAGVEYYPDNATMPVQFSRTAAGCGALFLWTRER